MQNSVWKLTAVVGVVGIGFLVVLQAQRGLSVPGVSGPQAEAVGSAESAATDLGDAVAFDAFAEPAAPEESTILQRSPLQAVSAVDPDPFSDSATVPPARGPRPLTHQQIAGAAPVPTRSGGDPRPAVQLASSEEEPEFFGLFDDEPQAAPPAAATPPGPSAPAESEPAPFLKDVNSAPADQARQPRPAPPLLLESVDPLAEPEPAGIVAGDSVPIRPPAAQNTEPQEPSDELDAGPDPFAAEPGRSVPLEDNAAEPPPSQAPSVADDPFAMESLDTEAAPEPTPAIKGTGEQLAPADEEPPELLPIPEQREDAPLEAPAIPEETTPAASEPAGPAALQPSAPEAVEPTAPAAPQEAAEEEAPRNEAPAATEPAQAGAPVGAPTEPKPLPKIDAPQPAPQINPGRVRLYDREPVRQSGSAPLPVISPARGVPSAPPRGRLSGVETGEFPGSGRVRADVPRGTQQPRLTIEKLAPTHAVLGQPLIYEIHVKNIGHSSAHQVVVEDRVPLGTQLTGSIPRAELVEKSLVWRFGELRPGQEQLIKVCVVPTTEGQVGSVATVNFVAEVAAETTITAPRLEMVLDGPKQVPLGAPVTFSFKVTNKGSGDATGVFVRSILPEELRHPDGDDLEYEIGVLPAGKSRELNLSMRAARAGEVVKHAVLTADGGIEIERQAALEIIGDRLVLSRKGPEQRYVGRTATFSNTVVNDGPRAILGAVVRESVPPGMEFVEATAGGTYDPEKRVVEWRIEQLAPKETHVLGVTLKCAQIGEQQSLVTASSSNGAQVEVASQTAVQGFAALGLEVPTVDGPVDVGQPVALRVQARNRGTVASTNVKLTIKVPAELELVRIQGPAKYAQAEGQVRFEPVAAIAGGEQADFELLLKPRRPGNARVEVEVASDQLKQPLSKEEIVYVLSPAG